MATSLCGNARADCEAVGFRRATKPAFVYHVGADGAVSVHESHFVSAAKSSGSAVPSWHLRSQARFSPVGGSSLGGSGMV